MQKDFFQQYGLSGWIFCSRQNTQWYLLDLSVLCERRGGMVWSAAAQRNCVIIGSAVGIYSRNWKIIWWLVSNCAKKNIRTKGHLGILELKEQVS
jgi:hypothetical protein